MAPTTPTSANSTTPPRKPSLSSQQVQAGAPAPFRPRRASERSSAPKGRRDSVSPTDTTRAVYTPQERPPPPRAINQARIAAGPPAAAYGYAPQPTRAASYRYSYPPPPGAYGLPPPPPSSYDYAPPPPPPTASDRRMSNAGGYFPPMAPSISRPERRYPPADRRRGGSVASSHSFDDSRYPPRGSSDGSRASYDSFHSARSYRHGGRGSVSSRGGYVDPIDAETDEEFEREERRRRRRERKEREKHGRKPTLGDTIFGAWDFIKGR